jgi:hypothetical protein
MGDLVERAKRLLTPLGYYSAAGDAASKVNTGNKGIPPEQLLNSIKGKAGVRPVELKNSGFENDMKGIPRISAQDAQDYFHSKLPQMDEERLLSKKHSEFEPNKGLRKTNFENYSVDGGNDYEERLLKTPPTMMQHGWTVDLTKPDSFGGDYTRSENFHDNDYVRRMGQPGPAEDLINNLETNYGPNYRATGISPLMREDPDKNFYYSTHWQNTPNVVGHLRMKYRDGMAGAGAQGDLFRPQFGKVMNLDELQSDWMQKARKEGIRGDPQQIAEAEQAINARRREYRDADNAVYDFQSGTPEYTEARRRRADANQAYQEAQAQYNKLSSGQPTPPPFMNPDDTDAWTNMLLKRALYVAAQKGMDGVQMTNGATHSKRWSGQPQLEDYYDNKAIPMMGKLIKKVDPTSSAYHDIPMVDKMETSPQMWLHGYTDQGRHYDTWGPFPGDDIPNQEQRIRRDYGMMGDNYSFEARPAGSDYSGGDQQNHPLFTLSPEARDKVLKDGFPFYKQGGAVDGDRDHDDINQVIDDAHAIARANPELVRKALAILKAHAGQGDNQ